MKHPSFVLIIFLALIPAALFGQEVISSGGSHAQGTGVSLSWTLGEPVTATLKSSGYILTQGFHQTRLSASAIEDVATPGLTLVVYPNPFTYVLHLRVDKGDFSNLRYSLLTLEGKILHSDLIRSSLTSIDLLPYASGNYLLRINRKNGELINTYKVIKQ